MTNPITLPPELLRRPNPPSLKQQALEQFAHVDRILRENGCIPAGCILAALEALPDE